jgi:hypothetical protein
VEEDDDDEPGAFRARVALNLRVIHCRGLL